MQQRISQLAIFIISCSGWLLLTSQATMAQIVADGSLSTSVTSNDGLNFTINGGDRAGTNLFQSFREFSIPTNGSAIFNTASDIRTIFSRVTGGNPSSIDGLIQTQAGTDLFLLNPAGIIFGANARLNVGGSFVSTTASRITFADGTEFATDTQARPLLSLSVPIGLQLPDTPTGITVQGNGSRTFVADPFALQPLVLDRTSGLQSSQGKSLVLLGQRIDLVGANLVAEQGQIELGAAIGEVNLQSSTTGWQLDYQATSRFGDIQLIGRSVVDVSGFGAGSIDLQGRLIRLQDGSTLVSQNSGLNDAGDIRMVASETIDVSGLDPRQGLQGGIISETLSLGKSGKITLAAPQINLSQDGRIASKTYSTAEAGKVQIQADRLVIDGTNPALPEAASTAIASVTLGPGNAGDVELVVDRLNIQAGGALNSVSFRNGNAGNLEIKANSIELSGLNPIGIPSTINGASFNDGDGGTVRIRTGKLLVRDGAALSATAFATGQGGILDIVATELIEVSGGGLALGDFSSSTINSAVLPLPVIFQALLPNPQTPTGDAGRIRLQTPTLLLSDGGNLGIRNEGTGNGGKLELQTHQLRLNKGSILAFTTSGTGGDVEIKTDLLLMRNQAELTTTAGGSGAGGNIQISSPLIVGLENSNITANANRGQGGNITIDTQAILGLQFQPQLTPGSDITASSQFGVNGTVQINNPDVDPNASLTELPIDLIDPTQQIRQTCTGITNSRFVISGRGGMPDNPNQQVSLTRRWSDVRPFAYRQSAQSKLAQQMAAIAPISQSTSLLPRLQQANAWQRDDNGNVQLIAQSALVRPSSNLTCARQ